MAQTKTKTRNLGRLSEIAQVFVRHGFGYFFETHRLTDIVPWTRKVTPFDGAPSQRGKALRSALDELGPTFVKFGQLLSMRPDILPPDIISELRGLQDDVRPFPFEQVEQVIEAQLGLTLERLFLEFDQAPLAAASIGQVLRSEFEELELRVAQLEHRLKLLERDDLVPPA
jgi:ubiquinone biosynthesis protein